MKDVGSINQLRLKLQSMQKEDIYLYQEEKAVSCFSLQQRRGGENCNIELSWRLCTQTEISLPFFRFNYVKKD